jgi:hypothetical protein
MADARGAWLVTLEWARPVEAWRGWLAVRWALARIDAEGRRAAIAPGSTEDRAAREDEANFYVELGSYSKASFFAFDYDHDGTVEVIALVSAHLGDGPIRSRGRVWTYRDGAVRLYPRAEGILVEDVRDVDRDGRPDLVTYAGVTGFASGCDGGYEYRATGPELLAHSLGDGSFSLADAIAARAARGVCPARPRLFEGDRLQVPDVAKQIACARLWGATAAEVHREIDRTCGSVKDVTCEPCSHRQLLDRWAGIDPPLILR